MISSATSVTTITQLLYHNNIFCHYSSGSHSVYMNDSSIMSSFYSNIRQSYNAGRQCPLDLILQKKVFHKSHKSPRTGLQQAQKLVMTCRNINPPNHKIIKGFLLRL